MKKICLFFTLFFVALVAVQAQEQKKVNQSAPTLSEPIAVLNKTMGWCYNKDSGKWNKGANKIEAAERIDQFNRFEFRIAKNDGHTYLVLRKDYEIGHYDYPLVKKGWKGHKAYVDWVIDYDAYKNRLDSLKPQKDEMVFDVLTYSFNVASEDKKAPVVDLAGKEEKHKLIIKFRADSTGQKVRFFIYSRDVLGEDFFTIKHFANNQSYNSYSPEGEIISSDKLYNHFYFETDYKFFLNFLKAPLGKVK